MVRVQNEGTFITLYKDYQQNYPQMSGWETQYGYKTLTD